MKPGPIRLVVVGASLGGLTALRILLGGLPRDFSAALAIVQHRRAASDSRLRELLSGASRLPLIEPDDKEPLQAGHVYLAPANYHMLVGGGTLWLSIDAPVIFARPSIDVLFESAADALGAEVMAVVLTGSSDDGAAGARAIKRAGGLVLVQDPADAESPALPRATIAATPVDAVLALPALCERVMALVAEGNGK